DSERQPPRLHGSAGEADARRRNRVLVLQRLQRSGDRQSRPNCRPRQRAAQPIGRRHAAMIERVIEWSIRNRFLVFLVAAALSVAGVFVLFRTPMDAIPDLSENQVIVFADWMGRSPREIEDQVTYPLSRKLQGLAGVKAVRSSSEFNFSMITIIFED